MNENKDNTNGFVSDDATSHLRIVLQHVNGGYVELRSFSDDKTRGDGNEQRWIRYEDDLNDDLNDALEWARTQSRLGRGVFIGHNPRQGVAGNNAAVKQMVAVWVDFDLEKGGITREAAMARIEVCPAEPTLITNSGHGIHAFWLFQATEDLTKWKTLQSGLYEFFKNVGADQSVKDRSRVMRWAGFPNQKNGQLVETSILRFKSSSDRPSIEDLLVRFGLDRLPTAQVSARHTNGSLVAFGTRQPFEAAISMNRNVKLTSIAGRLRKIGHTESEIHALLSVVNEERCEPSLDNEEVQRIAASVCRYEPDEQIGSDKRLQFAGELFASWGELSETDYETPEYMITGLGRGDLGMVYAPSNVGKSTFFRNLVVKAACGQTFLGMTAEGNPRRVMLLDYETSVGRFIEDLELMTSGLSQSSASLVKDNLWSYTAKRRGTPFLNLSDPTHFARLMSEAEEFQPDLVVIDTVSQAFNTKSENDNSEVTNAIMKPLTQLAIESNAAVLFAHHIGKAGSEQGGASNTTYRARGASAFEGMSVAAIELDCRKTTTGEKRLVMSYKKYKDGELPDLVLELNRETRWLEVVEGGEAIGNPDESYHKLIALVTEPMTAKAVQAKTHFLSDTTRKRYLNRAVKERRLEQPHRGSYQPRGYIPSDQTKQVA